jgi:hypothetical protein
MILRVSLFYFQVVVDEQYLSGDSFQAYVEEKAFENFKRNNAQRYPYIESAGDYSDQKHKLNSVRFRSFDVSTVHLTNFKLSRYIRVLRIEHENLTVSQK